MICPVCGAPLVPEGGACRCEKGHSFDRARAGYYNLLLDSASHGHGDDKTMLKARRAFLDGGWYAPLAEAAGEIASRVLPDGGALADAGCGEGYYTEKILAALKKAGRSFTACAFDVSKDAAKMTAARVKEAAVFVASAYRIPLATGSQDLVLSLFSPFARAEFARILKKDGFLLRAVPAEDHLWELKQALYDEPRKNRPDPVETDGLFVPVQTVLVQKKLLLPGEAARALFEMTPYARKTAPADRDKLAGIEELAVTLSVKLLLTKKACETDGARV